MGYCETLKPSFSPIFLLLLLLLLQQVGGSSSFGIGVNWGRGSWQALPAEQVVGLLKSNAAISRVKLLDADPQALQSLSGSNIRVTVGIPNSMLPTLNSSLKAAQTWLHHNLTRFLLSDSRLLIDYIVVGDEPFLQSYGEQFHPFVVGAAANVQTALSKANLAERVKVVAHCSSDTFQSVSGLPSKAQFRSDVNRTMIELLGFLNRHRAPLFVTISPFQSYYEKKNVSLDFALFRETARPLNDSHKTYKNSFDLTYDTVSNALSSAGFSQVDIIVDRVGWPTDGAANATAPLAEEFMKGLINHLRSISTKSPKLQNPPTETYIFSLLDEDNRSTATGNYERHWGMFTFDGQAKYQTSFGEGSRKLVNAQDVQYLSSRWCVVNNNQDLSNASARSLEACLAADCTAMSPGGSCFNLSWPGNISYAFNSYYQQHDQNAASCDFGGLGLITTVDPSMNSCRFVVGLRNSASVFMQKPVLLCWLVSPMITMILCLVLERW